MRIKSYFDSSIPTAMRQARAEFGEDVMLVTSRIASPEFRYLGDYEVVFAVDGSETAPQPKPVPNAFGELMRQQFVPAEVASNEAACPEDPGAIISRLQSTFLDLGINPAQAELLVALIRSCTPPPPEPALVLPEAAPPEIVSAALEINAEIDEPLIQPEPEPERLDRQIDRKPRQKSSVPGNTGLAMMLVALGFGMFRPVRTSK